MELFIYNNSMTEIKTDRLVLRKPTTKEEKLSICKQIGNWEVVKWLSHAPYPYTYKDCENFLIKNKDNEFSLSIFLDKKLIGGVGLILDVDNYYELGYWLGKSYWGKGYATESSKYLLEYALEKLISPKIKSDHFINNIASANVLKKLGFKEVGIEKIYSNSNKKEMDMMLLIL